MIPITRVSLPAATARSLKIRTDNLGKVVPTNRVAVARSRWHGASVLRRQLSAVLETMAHGRKCCNYCSDNLGTDIDHYCPIAEAPLSTFEWTNHLLACSRCNTHVKGSHFPRDPLGNPLIIDPTRDDPWDHIRLTPTTGQYYAITDKGRTTKELLLDHDLLARGRAAAWLEASDQVIGHSAAVAKGDAIKALQYQFRLLQRPNLDAFYAMLRWSEISSAHSMFDSRCLKGLLDNPALYRSWLSLP
jgi:5-methylcytosine-specific restriction endonuclease McrA